MRPSVAAAAAQQGGLITRRQAVEAGCTERELRTMTAVNGPWLVVRRGVYVERVSGSGSGTTGSGACVTAPPT